MAAAAVSGAALAVLLIAISVLFRRGIFSKRFLVVVSLAGWSVAVVIGSIKMAANPPDAPLGLALAFGLMAGTIFALVVTEVR